MQEYEVKLSRLLEEAESEVWEPEIRKQMSNWVLENSKSLRKQKNSGLTSES